MSPHAQPIAMPGRPRLSALPPLSLYVHLPWCLKKCPYCDFNSHAVDSQPGGQAPEAAYLDALRADLEASLPSVWGRPVHTVFIGGGTPSLFSPEAIDRLLTELRALLRLDADAEITLEANPGTFEAERFRAYAEAGVTRLSVGVQSFDDRMLKALGRVHDAAQARAAVELAGRAFETFNLDLMYALPGQTLADAQRDVDAALALQPPHLSLYHLTIEPNTLFAARPPQVPDEDSAYAMLDMLLERSTQAGLARYEVSAYARPGHRCRHNLNYWRFGDYLGIGAGAHSKLSFPDRIERQVRWRDPARYLQGARDGLPVAQRHEVAAGELPFEFMLNALRLVEGVPAVSYAERTGLPLHGVRRILDDAQRRGWLQGDPQRLAATPQGLDFLSDLQALFLPDTPGPSGVGAAAST